VVSRFISLLFNRGSIKIALASLNNGKIAMSRGIVLKVDNQTPSCSLCRYGSLGSIKAKKYSLCSISNTETVKQKVITIAVIKTKRVLVFNIYK
jgi:hypothetical protein